MTSPIDLNSLAITKQISSPHAKYTSRGKLMCIVCGVEVKSAIIWKAHINKRSHLENLSKLQEKQHKLNSIPKNSVQKSFKRPSSQPYQPGKKKKDIPDQKPPKGILKGITNYSSDESDDEDVKPVLQPQLPSDQTNGDQKPVNNLPEGFFDDGSSGPPVRGSWQKEHSPPRPQIPTPNTSETLPEGFFDDPVADAKARKVEYRDKEAEEWQTFMKEVSEAELQSRQIIAVDKEEAAMQSQIQQASDQIQHLQKVVDLDKQKTDHLQIKGERIEEANDSSSDEEFCPVIWRTKSAFK